MEYDVASVAGETHEYFNRLGRQVTFAVPPRHSPLEWFDEQVAEVESL